MKILLAHREALLNKFFFMQKFEPPFVQPYGTQYSRLEDNKQKRPEIYDNIRCDYLLSTQKFPRPFSDLDM